MTMDAESATLSTLAEATEPTLELLNRPPITYQSALNTDKNMIHEAGYVAATKALYQKLWEERNTIRALTKHHLGLGDRDTCIVAHSRQGFEAALIIDEKMGCEVGTYAWMQEKCPDIRIPHLYGFGFSDHRHFTHEAHRPLYARVARYLRRLLRSLVKHPALLSRYMSHPTTHRLCTAYMLLEHVGSDTSQMLSNTWDKRQEDPTRRQRLFRGMARLMLSLARVPQPQIGSFRFHDNGTITLTNRPLTCSIMILENDGTPRTIQRNKTYACTEPFIADLFSFHDKRFLSHPNAVFDDKDCHGEMAAKVMLRALAHRYTRQDQRNGPFFLQLSDLHASNIFVDDRWNVTCIIDLEWVCALPVENLSVPYWLTGCAIDEIRNERLVEFDKIRQEFMDVFEEEERKVAAEHGFSLTQIMRETWESGGMWFWHSIMATNAMYPLFTYHICPRFSRPVFREEEFLSKFWREDAAKVVKSKVAEYHMYETELKQIFSDERNSDSRNDR